MKLTFVKTADGQYMPMGESQTLRRLVPGEMIVMEVKRQRNAKFHRLAMSWLSTVFDNQDIFQTFDQMRYAITCHAGYIDYQMAIGDKVVMRPKSLAFEHMDEAEFSQWQSDVDRVLREQYGLDIPMIGEH